MEMKVSNGEYASPKVKVIKIQMTQVIATSGDQMTVSDPWGSNIEKEW